MALVLKDRVRQTSTTAGTGTITLSGSVTGFQGFSVIGSGNTTYYTIADQSGANWEVGLGTYTSPNQLSRDTVYESSNSNNLVNFTSGTKDVFVTYPAEQAIYQDASNNVGIGTAAPAAKLEITVPSGGVQNLNLTNTTAASSASLYVDDFAQFNIYSGVSTYISSGTATSIDSSAGNLTLSAYGATSDVNIYADNAITVGANANNIVATTDTATGYIFSVNNSAVGGVGNNNVALGYANFGAWLGYITTESNNIGIGNSANYSQYNLASNNIAIGTSAMYDGSTGTKNIALGFEAYKGNGSGTSSPTGSNNICIGNGAGSLLTSQSDCVFIGAFTGNLVGTGTITIGDGSGKKRFEYNGGSGTLGLWTGSTTTERLRIDNNGNILNISTGGLGYGTGSGGAVTQATSRTTGVTLNKTNGAITLVSAAGSTTWNSFTVTNNTVAATDTVIVSQKSGTDLYQIFVTNVAAGSFKISFATTGGTTTEQPVFNFAEIGRAHV